MAQSDLYDNGPTNGKSDGWMINFPFEVSDSFNLSTQADVTGINFAVWLLPGYGLQTVEVSITSSEFGGTSYFDEAVSLTQSGCAPNPDGFDVCTESGTFPAVTLKSGTYWINLQNALGDPVYWDENSGPSSASDNSVGTIPSESFTLYGSSTSGTTPEPSTLVLFGSGIVSFAARLRRKLF